MTDDRNELKILGDVQDNVTLNKTGWTATGTQGTVKDGFKEYVYTKGTDTVTLKVEPDVPVI